MGSKTQSLDLAVQVPVLSAEAQSEDFSDLGTKGIYRHGAGGPKQADVTIISLACCSGR
jgi:hypothetical protein